MKEKENLTFKGYGYIMHPMKRMSILESLGISLAVGIVAAGIGILLSITVIGAVIGIPLIVIGLGAILLSPFFLLTSKVVECPSCGFENKSLIVFNNALTCRSCKKRILIKNNNLVTA